VWHILSDTIHAVWTQKGLGYSHSLSALRTVVDYFTMVIMNHGSNVNLCAVDMSKAFEKVKYYAIFSKVLDRSGPHEFLCILICFSMSAAYVRWVNLSDMISLVCGVRQGGIPPTQDALVLCSKLHNMCNVSGWVLLELGVSHTACIAKSCCCEQALVNTTCVDK